MTKPKTVYYPSRRFDDTLAAFADMVADAGWTLTNGSAEELKADAQAQRDERARLELAQAEVSRLEAEFAHSQQERFKRFSAMLHAVRGAFRNDPAIRAQLDQFKRKSQTRAKPAVADEAV